MLFEGYTGGGNKEVIDGLMSTGDIGHLDDDGRLFVEGRDDEMIVSGGENVFPAEVEDLLASPRRRRGGGGDRRGRRASSASASRRSWSAATAPRSTPRTTCKGYVRENLARFKIPRDVEFVDELPRNATGKILDASCATRSQPLTRLEEVGYRIGTPLPREQGCFGSA